MPVLIYPWKGFLVDSGTATCPSREFSSRNVFVREETARNYLAALDLFGVFCLCFGFLFYFFLMYILVQPSSGDLTNQLL